MARRARIFPPDDITAGVWLYLTQRYPPDEVEERRERLAATLRRLVRRGRNAQQVHEALLHGTQLWEGHGQQLRTRKDARRKNAAVARARKDVARALVSLRRLLRRIEFPGVPSFEIQISDDALFEFRDRLLTDVSVAPGKRGRPWEWKHETEEALRQAGVVASDRRELLAALGFVDDE